MKNWFKSRWKDIYRTMTLVLEATGAVYLAISVEPTSHLTLIVAGVRSQAAVINEQKFYFGIIFIVIGYFLHFCGIWFEIYWIKKWFWIKTLKPLLIGAKKILSEVKEV